MPETLIIGRSAVVPSSEIVEQPEIDISAAEAEPGPPPEPQPIPFVYDRTHQPPPVASDEALDLLVKHRGRLAYDELIGSAGPIAVLDTDVKGTLQVLVAGAEPSIHYPRLLDAMSRRSVYASRGAALAKRLKVKLTIPPAPEIPDITTLFKYRESADPRWEINKLAVKIREEFRDVDSNIRDKESDLADPERYAMAGAGESDRNFWMRRLERYAKDIHDDLATLRPHDDSLPRVLPEGEYVSRFRSLFTYANGLGGSLIHPCWAQDAVLKSLDAELSRRRERDSRIAALQGDESRTQEIVAHMVRSAVEAHGGLDAIASCARDALLDSGRWYESASQWKALVETRNKIAALEARLKKIDRGSVLGTKLDTELKALAMDVEVLEQSADRERRGEIAALVTSACEGHEDARAALQSIAESNRGAFPEGFPQALTDAHFRLAVLAELVKASTVKGQ